MIDIRKLYRGLASIFPLILLFSTAFSTALFFAPSAEASLVVNSTPDTLTNGLVGWWTFDSKDMKNNVVDRSGNGNHGRLVGFGATSTATVMGKVGQALTLDGVNDYVSGPSISDGSSLDLGGTQWTMSSWVNLNSFTEFGRIIIASDPQNNNNGILPFNSNNFYQFIVIVEGGTNTDIVSRCDSFNPKRDQWYHVTGTWDGTNANIYVNGTLCKTATGSSTYNDWSGDSIYMGSRRGSSEFLNGTLDDVRIYSRALSASEVKQLYNLGQDKYNASAPNNPSFGLNTGLVGHWTFDAKDMKNNVADRSGNGNHGYMQGFTSTTTATVMGKMGQAVKFDGVDDYVKINTNPISDLSTPNTGCAWAVTSNIFNVQSGYGERIFNFYIDANNYFSMSVTDGGLYIGYKLGGDYYGKYKNGVLENNTWSHLCYSWNGSDLSLYSNGVLLSGYSNTSASSATPNSIGSRGSSSGFWIGSIDDVRIYSRALSASEVKQLYSLGQDKYNASAPNNPSFGLNTGLVGYWTFDAKDMKNNVADRSGNGNHGYMTGFTSTTTATVMGKLGQGLRFDGVNDSINAGTGASLNISGAVTVSAWVKTVNASNHKVIVTRGEVSSVPNKEQYHLGFNGDTIPRFWISNGTIRLQSLGTAGSAPNGVWNHIVGVYNGTDTTRLYINGVQVDADTTASFGSLNSATMGVGIGALQTSQSGWINSNLDDVRIYNRALSASEIKQLYNMGR